MAPAEISAQRNPLRSPKDYRLNRIAGPSSLIIFGVTGDLSRKKLMPAVYDLANRGLLPPGLRAGRVRAARLGRPGLRAGRPRLGEAVRPHRVPRGRVEPARAGIRFVQGEFDDDEAFERLHDVVDELDRERGTRGNHAFYLSIPPKSFPLVAAQLKHRASPSSTTTSGGAWSSRSRSATTWSRPAS